MTADEVISLWDGFIALLNAHWVIVGDFGENVVKIRDPWPPNAPRPGEGIEADLDVTEFLKRSIRGGFTFVYRQ